MRRAFFSLYGLIVLAVIAVGWGLDRVWQSQMPSQVLTETDYHLLHLVQVVLQQNASAEENTAFVLEHAAPSMSLEALQAQLALLTQKAGLDIALHSVDDFANSQLSQRLSAGEPIAVDTGNTRWVYFKLAGTEHVLVWRQAPHDVPNSWVYNLLLLAFYIVIALVIFLWIWPLSRDLNKLEKQTQFLEAEDVPKELRIASSSAVYQLASAFQHMGQRVRDLLASHKEMTYAVSHELRTPLARMKFGLEMADNFNDVEKIKQQLRGVRDDVTEMDALVNQLFAYAGFEQKDPRLDLQPGDMKALIQQLIVRAQSSSNQKAIAFEFDETACSQDVICEWYLMERAILNLLLNAQRYAKSRILVRLSVVDGIYQVQVEDDGPGVPAGQEERIFQSFIRLTDPVNATARGLGLGLAIVQRVMRWHNGRAYVKRSSSLGGACFQLVWPLDQA